MDLIAQRFLGFEIFPIAAPVESPKLLFGRKEFGPGRIEMDVIAHGLEITVAAAVDKKTLVAAAKQMAEKFVPPVEAGSIGPQQPFHAVHQIGFWRFDHEMEMIAHEAPGMDLPVGFGARLSECFNEQFAILVAAEDIFVMIAAVHHVINRPSYRIVSFRAMAKLWHEGPMNQYYQY